MPQGFNFLLADRSRQLTVARMGAARRRAAPAASAFPRPADRAYLLVPAGARGPAFLMLQNFRVIMKYNPAEAYALAIGHLADRLRGGGPIVQAWPRDERVLTRAERSNCSSTGRARLRHRRAGRPARHQDPRRGARFPGREAGWFPDGFASAAMLDRLRRRDRAIRRTYHGSLCDLQVDIFRASHGALVETRAAP